MRAIVYDEPGRPSLRDVPVPVPGPRDVVVDVALAGVCGTDLHVREGGFGARFPLTPGHEITGTVAATGHQVAGLVVGEAVVVSSNIACGWCPHCRQGRALLCERLESVGITRPGGFAEQVVVPFEHVLPVAGLPHEVAVLVEPTACAVHGLEVAAVRPGSSALVLGAGPTGLLLAQLLAHGGAASVTVAASTAFKLERASALGVDETLLMDRGDLPASVAALMARRPDGYDVVVEATGSAAVGQACVPLTRSGGTVVVYGVASPDERWSVSPFELFSREITVRGSFAQIDAFPAAIAALASGRVRTDGLVTHRFALAEHADALEALRHDPAAHEVVIDPRA